MVDEKQKKAAIKEGGKKGVDAVGVSDMGGVKYFHVNVDVPEGDFELLHFVLEGMNAEVDESAEERKGGASALGKMLLSAGAKKLAVVCHVPAALAQEKGLTAKDWVETVLKPVDGKILKTEGDIVEAEVLGDAEKNRFPLKLRDDASAAGFALLRARKLVPEPEDSDDEFVCDPEAAGIGEW